ncbi:MAG: RNA polymerase sigma factor [Tuberibacillus sp.]
MLTEEKAYKNLNEKDQYALEFFIHKYHLSVYKHLEGLLRNREKAEDFTQETFLKLLRQIMERQVPENVRAWLFSVANNLCRDYWRSSGFKSEWHILDQLPEPSDGRGQVIDIVEQREKRNELAALLNELPDLQRQIVYLRFYNDLKLKEIAMELACPLGTVKSRLFHALRFLKSRIEEKGNVSYG